MRRIAPIGHGVQPKLDRRPGENGGRAGRTPFEFHASIRIVAQWRVVHAEPVVALGKSGARVIVVARGALVHGLTQAVGRRRALYASSRAAGRVESGAVHGCPRYTPAGGVRPRSGGVASLRSVAGQVAAGA